MKIVIDDKIPFIRGEAEKLGQTVYLPGKSISAKDVADADALIIRTRTRCDSRLLEGSKVKFIATATIGYDHLDTAYLAERGIAWTNCPGCNAASVAQYVENTLLLFSRAGKLDLSDCTVGIVGVGNVGSRVAEALRPYGLRLLLCDPPRQEKEGGDFCRLEEIAASADVVTFHTPLTTSGKYPTAGMAGRAFFDSLAKQPILINSSRGEVVNTQALLDAIGSGKLRGTAIDTWEDEPSINLDLLAAVDIGTPHIAGYSADGKANGTRMALEAVARHFGLDLTFNVCPPPLPKGFCLPSNVADCKLALYDPRRDSKALKDNPAAFETQRGNYPLRREYAAVMAEAGKL